MLERRSALADVATYTSSVLQIGEARGFSLTQASGPMPELQFGVAALHEGRTYMQVGPSQFWIIGPENDDFMRGQPGVVPLSSSRTRIFLEGEPARLVLSKGIPLDFHARNFTPGMYAMTGLHHTPVLIHCVGDHRFELYVMRTFAISVWEWLADAAQEFSTR